MYKQPMGSLSNKPFSQKFTCKSCNIETNNKKDYNNHLLTRKHARLGIQQPIGEKIGEKILLLECSKCNKSYETRSGLWRHRKSCNDKSENIIISAPLVTETESININESSPTESSANDTKILTNLVLELVKSNSELQKQLVDACKNNSIMNSHNNNNNSNYSHNKTFNLQFFLNEQCKDAMNINEFVSSFDLQISDLESVGELGYVDGITKIVLDKLNSMDVHKRPMHCSDAKRETIYIKDANLWAKELPGNPKLRQAIKHISFNNMKLVYNWSNAYPESMDNQSRLNDTYIKLVLQSSGGSGPILDSENKIMRRIAKEIVIGKT
jgi:hypothetical protein